MISITELKKMLPDGPSPEVSAKYSFLDTAKVAEDMADLGYNLVSFERPKVRTQAGKFSLHQLDFRLPEDKEHGEDVPRILFNNSYDGSRRAIFRLGIFRVLCSNGLVAGEEFETQKFLHIGQYEEEMLSQIKTLAQRGKETLEAISRWKKIKLTPDQKVDMAEKALHIRFPLEQRRIEIKPEILLSPRRKEDIGQDLYTSWNVVQENLIRGGVPGRTRQNRIRLTSPIRNIYRRDKVNQQLWGLMEETAKAA